MCMDNNQLIAALCAKVIELNEKNAALVTGVSVLRTENDKLRAENKELRVQIALEVTT